VRILKVVQAYYPFQEKGGPVAKVGALARGLVERAITSRFLPQTSGFAIIATREPISKRASGDGAPSGTESKLSTYLRCVTTALSH